MSARNRVLVLAFDPLTDAMPGPAIRAWNLAEQLSAEHDVVLAGTLEVTRSHPSMEVRAASSAELVALAGRADVVVAPTSVARRHPELASNGPPLCIDMYIPTHLENLEALGAQGSEEHRAAVAHQVAVTNEDLATGDFFLCASERQRHFWLGALSLQGRVNPATYEDDPSLRRLIDVVPFGVPGEEPPEPDGALRRAFPGIQSGDPVLVWGGGVYNWFDPLSLLAAVDELRKSIPGIRLVFLGLRHPNPGIPEMRVAQELRELSDRLGLTGRNVFLNEGWTPYSERGRYLVDADIGVSTHLAHVETRYSFRTRVLDYLWAGLPTVLTEGDSLTEEVAGAGLGAAVPPGDPSAIAAAVAGLLQSPPARSSVRAFARRYLWEVAVGPLLAYCSSPWRAADKAVGTAPARRGG